MLFCAARSPAVLACSSNYKAQRSGLITSVARSGPRPEALSTGTAWARPPTSSGVYGVFPAVCTGHAAPRLPLQGHQSRAPMPTPASQQFAAARRGGIAAAAGPGSWNPVEVVKREAGLQSNKWVSLPSGLGSHACTCNPCFKLPRFRTMVTPGPDACMRCCPPPCSQAS